MPVDDPNPFPNSFPTHFSSSRRACAEKRCQLISRLISNSFFIVPPCRQAMPTHFQTHFQLMFHRPAVRQTTPTHFQHNLPVSEFVGAARGPPRSELTVNTPTARETGDSQTPCLQGAPRSHTPPRTLRTQGQLGGPGGVCVCVGGGGGGGQMLTAPCGHQRLEGTQQPRTMMMGLVVALMVFIDGASGGA